MCLHDETFVLGQTQTDNSRRTDQLFLKGIDVSPSRIKIFEKWGSAYANRLKNISFNISNILQDNLIGECFEDLRYSVDITLPHLLSKAPISNQGARQHIGEYIDAIAYGAEERLYGNFHSMETFISNFSQVKSGIQRVLKAARYIPQSLFARLGMKWNGFFISGFLNKEYSCRTEIINLPFECLFKPEEWWGVFHEMGHVAFWNPKNLNFNHPNILNAVEAATKNRRRPEEIIHWKNLAWELGADVFDLFF